MKLHRIRVAPTAGLAAAAVLLVGSLVGGSPFSSAAPARPVADDLAQLQEFKTPGDKGWFYTLDRNEAASAQSKYHFTKSADIGVLHTKAAPGTTAVHRLRHKGDAASYMLSVSPNEIKDSRFTDEGVLGYIDSAQHPGQTRLLRFSNNGKWRVFRDNATDIANMKAAGYAVDGPMGWYS